MESIQGISEVQGRSRAASAGCRVCARARVHRQPYCSTRLDDGIPLAQAAADQKYEPAVEVLKEFVRRGIPIPADSAGSVKATSDTSSPGAVKSFELVYLNFGPDTTSHVSDLTLLDEAFREGERNSERRSAYPPYLKIERAGHERDSGNREGSGRREP